MARNSKERIAELLTLRDRCLAISRFLAEGGLSEDATTEMKAAIQAAFERGDLGGLKMFSRDLNEWANGMPPATIARLDDILRSELGEDPRGTESEARDLERILHRGTIEDEEEYRLLTRRVEEIYADGSKGGELEKINELLVAFEEKLAGPPPEA
jgi:hypothetical protein